MIGQYGNGFKSLPNVGLFVTEPSFQKGSGIFISEPLLQRGSGLFSFLSRGVKMLTPLVRKGVDIAKRVASSAPVKKLSQKVSDTAINVATDVVSDMIEGKDPSENLKVNLTTARKDISETLRKELKRKNMDNSSIINQSRKRKKPLRKQVNYKTKSIL